MNKLGQKGNSALLLVAIAVLVLLLIGSIIFGFSTYSGQQDYKNNADQKIAAAVKVAIDKNSTDKDNQFSEQLKNPLKTFKGQSTYGAVTVKYPRTWSAYVDETNTTSTPEDGYFYPNFVPGIQSNTNFALRVQVTTDDYSDLMKQFGDSLQNGDVRISAYRAAKVPSVLGSEITGKIADGKTGIMVMFPLRDKTIKVWTESSQFYNDFNKYILPNLSFSP